MLQASATLSALDVLSCGYIMYRKPSLLLDILTVTDIQWRYIQHLQISFMQPLGAQLRPIAWYVLFCNIQWYIVSRNSHSVTQ